jgi:hypothetical protein
MQILKNSSILNIKQKHGNPMQKLKISSILNIEQMHGNTATPIHLQLLMNQTMEHPYRTDINHVIEYDDLSSSQDLPDTFRNDVNR